MKPMLVLAALILVEASSGAALEPLTPDDAVQAALLNNRDLAAERVRIEEARSQLQQAGLWPNPELEVGGRFDKVFKNEGEHQFAVGLSQPFSVSGRIGAQKSLAEVNLQLAMAEVADFERRVTGEVYRTFAELAALDEQLSLQSFLIGLNEELLSVTQGAMAAGQASEKDVNASEIELLQSKRHQQYLETERRSHWLELERLMGQPIEIGSRSVEAPSSEVPVDSSLFSLDQALTRRPDVVAAQCEVELARAGQRLAKSERFENWKMGAAYERELSVVDGAPPQNVDQFVGLNLTVPLPLFDRHQGRLRETQAAEERAIKGVEALKLQVSQELADARQRVSTLGLLLESYTPDILGRADSNLKLVQEGYQQGLIGIVEAIQSRRQFAELKSAYIDTQKEYHQAINDLRIAAGILPGKPSEAEKP